MWKIHSPPKTRLFLWCVLENKVPTWDNLQKRGFQGSGSCVLCKAESVIHLFLTCPYCVQVWKECVKLLGLGLECRWEGDSILLAWENWKKMESLEIMAALPFLVTWGIWLARNNLIFNGKACTPSITASMSCGVIQALPSHIQVKN